MKNLYLFTVLSLLFFLTACNSNEKEPQVQENPVPKTAPKKPLKKNKNLKGDTRPYVCIKGPNQEKVEMSVVMKIMDFINGKSVEGISEMPNNVKFAYSDPEGGMSMNVISLLRRTESSNYQNNPNFSAVLISAKDFNNKKLYDWTLNPMGKIIEDGIEIRDSRNSIKTLEMEKEFLEKNYKLSKEKGADERLLKLINDNLNEPCEYIEDFEFSIPEIVLNHKE